MLLDPRIFKANDIRGVIIGDEPEWDLDGARGLGAAFVELLGLAGGSFVLGRDMRQRGEELAEAFTSGARAAGASVVDVGLTSTDELWFASGLLSLPGVQFTASHNPASYNGIKFCLADAAPVPADFMQALAALAQADRTPTATPGSYRRLDVLGSYAERLRSLAQVPAGRRLRVVVDAGNGMAGHTVTRVFEGLNIELIGLYLELDGTFPNHPANPLVPENLVDAQRAVLTNQADLGLVFDGDADRCFIIDERGRVVDPSLVTALIAAAELAKEPGGTIVVNTITSATVAKVVAEAGGQVVVSQVGHTYVKAKIAQHHAVFGGEHSAHYYFRDFWGADTGMLAALHIIAMMAASSGALSDLVADYDVYRRSGELNFVVSDVGAAMDAVATRFGGRGALDRTDGLTVRRHDDGELAWWFNVRPSNTEPLLRLNVEAADDGTMVAIRDEVIALIEEDA